MCNVKRETTKPFDVLRFHNFSRLLKDISLWFAEGEGMLCMSYSIAVRRFSSTSAFNIFLTPSLASISQLVISLISKSQLISTDFFNMAVTEQYLFIDKSIALLTLSELMFFPAIM